MCCLSFCVRFGLTCCCHKVLPPCCRHFATAYRYVVELTVFQLWPSTRLEKGSTGGPPGCDILTLYVDEPGAFNTRNVGTVTLPKDLFLHGYTGTMPLQGMGDCRGSLYLSIRPLASAPDVLSSQALCPPQAQAPPLPDDDLHNPWLDAFVGGSSSNFQPVVRPVVPSSNPPATALMVPDSAAASSPADSEVDTAVIAMPAATAAPSAPQALAHPVATAVTRRAIVASVHLDLTVCTLNVAQILDRMTQSPPPMDNWIHGCTRGDDTKVNVSWLCFGFDIRLKKYPASDFMAFDVGPAKIEQAKSLHDALSTVQCYDDAQASICLQTFKDISMKFRPHQTLTHPTPRFGADAAKLLPWGEPPHTGAGPIVIPAITVLPRGGLFMCEGNPTPSRARSLRPHVRGGPELDCKSSNVPPAFST